MGLPIRQWHGGFAAVESPVQAWMAKGRSDRTAEAAAARRRLFEVAFQ